MKSTASAHRSVGYDVLKALQDRGETSSFLQARLDYAEAAQLLHQHIEPLVGRRRVYPNMCLPQASGRVGISDPPIGNFTADPGYGPHGLRDVVRPDTTTRWICADWSSVEGWIVSHRCQDPVDLEAKQRGLDLHTVTAIRMFRYPDPPADPTKEWLKSNPGQAWRAQVGFTESIRGGVKNTRYTMQYAKQATTVARYAVKLGLPPKQLIEFGHRYLKAKPWLVKWKEQRWAEAWRRKEARTAFGRRRRLLGDRYQVEKEGLNHEVQGTVADMMKTTMVALAEIGCHMALQRHDGWCSSVDITWDDMASYKAIVERTWEIDGRSISFPSEYETIEA